jgi:hypothetical protein
MSKRKSLMIDEGRLEEAFWEFDYNRKISGAERDAFKQKARGLLQYHLHPLYALLARAEIYLVAYTTQHEPPGGMEQAHLIKKEMMEVLEDYRRSTNQ